MKESNMIIHSWYVIDKYFKSRYYGNYKGQHVFITECYQEILLINLDNVQTYETNR